MAGLSVIEVSSLVGAGVKVAGALGGLISFVWVRFEVTHRQIKKELKKCEEREIKGRERRGILTTVIELLWMKVKEHDPASPALARAKDLLDGLKHDDRMAYDDDAIAGSQAEDGPAGT